MNILKLALVLLLICGVVAGVLGGVNYITDSRIEQQQLMKTEKAYAAVLASDSYKEVNFDKAQFPMIDTIAEAGNGKGYVVMESFTGAQGKITMAVGVDKKAACTGISIVSHSETSGLGANAASAAEVGVAFREQFVGEGADMRLSKSGGNIDALTGATITTQAITDAAATAVRAVGAILQGGAAA